MTKQTEAKYEPPEDVKFIAKTYPVESLEFTKALLTVRYNKMDCITQRRAEKTLRCLVSGLAFCPGCGNKMGTKKIYRGVFK